MIGAMLASAGSLSAVTAYQFKIHGIWFRVWGFGFRVLKTFGFLRRRRTGAYYARDVYNQPIESRSSATETASY